MKPLFTLLTALVLLSCNTQKPAVTAPIDVQAPVESSELFSKFKEPLHFDAIKINAKVDAEIDTYIPTLSTTIYIENGKKVWMNMNALINIARGIATPDGVKAYEKWNKTYIESDFTYLNQLLNVDFIDYNALQNLLLGKACIPLNENDFVVTQNSSGYLLTSKNNQKIVKDGKTYEYSVKLQYDANFNLNQLFLEKNKSNEALEILYSNWIKEGNLDLPKNVKIIIKSSKTSQISIENTTFAFTTMENKCHLFRIYFFFLLNTCIFV